MLGLALASDGRVLDSWVFAQLWFEGSLRLLSSPYVTGLWEIGCLAKRPEILPTCRDLGRLK